MAELRNDCLAWEQSSSGVWSPARWCGTITFPARLWNVRRSTQSTAIASPQGTGCDATTNKPESRVPVFRFGWLNISALLLLSVLPLAAAESPQVLPSTWPQPYSVQRNKAAGLLTLSTPYYTMQHDLKQGGAISSIRLTHGKATNLLVRPFETRVQDAAGIIHSDLAEPAPRVTIRQDGLNELVTVESALRDAQGKRSGVRVKTVYEYRWGYVKIHKELIFPGKGFRTKDISPVSTVLAPSLSDYGYRDGLTEQGGAPAFPFGSCHWGKLNAQGATAIDTPYVPRYVMFSDPGVEGIEWFVSSDLAQWEVQPAGKRGHGKSVLRGCATPSGVVFSVSPFQDAQSPALAPARLTFDYYLGLPLLEGRALKPWFHSSFNRNRGDWVSTEQMQRWAQTGIQTVHCHNDGDYYDDGLFWRDGSYPPYPDMDGYDRVRAGW